VRADNRLTVDHRWSAGGPTVVHRWSYGRLTEDLRWSYGGQGLDKAMGKWQGQVAKSKAEDFHHRGRRGAQRKTEENLFCHRFARMSADFIAEPEFMYPRTPRLIPQSGTKDLFVLLFRNAGISAKRDHGSGYSNIGTAIRPCFAADLHG
jgi:hypothetical protein